MKIYLVLNSKYYNFKEPDNLISEIKLMAIKLKFKLILNFYIICNLRMITRVFFSLFVHLAQKA